MCKWGNHVIVRVKIATDLSYTHQERWAEKGIDSCIAPIVKALQDAGIDMRGSCCAHNKGVGSIDLQDGRTLLILDKDMANKYRNRGRDGYRLA
jgi:hypothetical protein